MTYNLTITYQNTEKLKTVKINGAVLILKEEKDEQK